MDTDARPPLRLWMGTAALGLIAAVLGYLGYGFYLDGQPDFEDAGIADRIYYTLQLFLLDPTPLDAPPYGPLLSTAMYLAPLATVLAVLQAVSLAFREQIASWRLRRRRGHAVVVGAGPEAFALARQLGGASVLIGSNVSPTAARRHGVRLVAGDPVDEATLRAAGVVGAARVFALSEVSATNAGVALLVRELHRVGVTVHARADDGKLVAALRARRLAARGSDDRYQLDFFSLEDLAAVALLDGHDDGRPPTVIGNTPFAAAVVREVRRRRRHAGEPEVVEELPGGNALPFPPLAGTVYVAMHDPDQVLHIGLSLLLAGHSRIVLCLGARSLLADALEQQLFGEVDSGLEVFGILDAACDPVLLERNALVERLARALHTRYLAEYGRAPTRPSHRPWNELAPGYQEDNRRQAEHIGTKLAAIHAAIVPAAPGLPPFTFRGDEFNDLARMEHDRWVAAKREAGFVYGVPETATTHPDVLDWDDPRLTEAAREKDRLFVRNLPALLDAEDLAIVRLPPPD